MTTPPVSEARSFYREGWTFTFIPSMDRRALQTAADNGTPFVCQLCAAPLNVGDYVFLQLDPTDTFYIHQHWKCSEDLRVRERDETAAMMNNPWLIERAATAAGLTIAQFLELPAYARESRLRSLPPE